MKAFNINTKKLIAILLMTYCMGLLTYGYVFVNFVPAQDGIMTFCTDQLWQISIGRCLMKYYVQARGIVEAPWLIGMLTLLYVSLSVYFVTDIMQLSDDYWKYFIVSSVFTLNLTLINSAVVYIYLLDIYALALLFSTAAVYTYVNIKGLGGIVLSAIFTAVSMGLYQSYLAVEVGLFIILMIMKTIKGYDKINNVVKDGCRIVGVLALGAVLYTLMLMFISKINGVPTDVFGVSGAGNISVTNIAQLVGGSYARLFKFFFKEFIYNSNSFKYVNLIVFLAGVVAYALIVYRLEVVWKKILLVFLLAVFPIGINFLYILTAGQHLHYLMMFSYQLVYILFLYPFMNELVIFYDKGVIVRRYAILITTLLSVIIIRFANDLFYYQKIVGEGVSATMTNILYDIERNTDFNPDDKTIVILGVPGEALAQNYMVRAAFQQYSGIESGTTLTFKWTVAGYLYYVLGRDYKFDDSDELEQKLAQLPEVEQMPVYPNAGYSQVVDDYLVIKLDDCEKVLQRY